MAASYSEQTSESGTTGITGTKPVGEGLTQFGGEGAQIVPGEGEAVRYIGQLTEEVQAVASVGEAVAHLKTAKVGIFVLITVLIGMVPGEGTETRDRERDKKETCEDYPYKDYVKCDVLKSYDISESGPKLHFDERSK
jgi:hypothetical protein